METKYENFKDGNYYLSHKTKKKILYPLYSKEKIPCILINYFGNVYPNADYNYAYKQEIIEEQDNTGDIIITNDEIRIIIDSKEDDMIGGFTWFTVFVLKKDKSRFFASVKRVENDDTNIINIEDYFEKYPEEVIDMYNRIDNEYLSNSQFRNRSESVIEAWKDKIPEINILVTAKRFNM